MVMKNLFKYNNEEFILYVIGCGFAAIIFSLFLFCAFSFIIGLQDFTNIIISFIAFVICFIYLFVNLCKDYNNYCEKQHLYVNKLLLKDKSESYKGVCGSDFVLKD